MGGAHGLVAAGYVPGSSRLHRIAPQCKIAATVLFVLAVVATPRESFWAFGVYGGILVGVAVVARVPGRLILRRLTLEAPFVAFAVLLPVVGRGERVEVLGVS